MYGAQLIGAEHPYAHIIKLVQRALVGVAVFVALPKRISPRSQGLRLPGKASEVEEKGAVVRYLQHGTFELVRRKARKGGVFCRKEYPAPLHRR